MKRLLALLCALASLSWAAPAAADLGDPVEIATPVATTSATPSVLTTNVAVPAGGGFWCVFTLFGTSDTLTGISDNSGNSYTYNIQTVQGSGSANRKVYTAWVDAPGGLPSGTVITPTYSGSSGGRAGRAVGFSGQPAFEAHAGTGGNNTGPIAINVPTAGTVANANALELLVSINGNGSVTGGSVDSDFTAIGSEVSSGGTGSTSGRVRLRWRRAATSAQVAFSETISATAEWAVAYDILYDTSVPPPPSAMRGRTMLGVGW